MRKREIIIVWAGKTLDNNERQWMSFRAIHLTGPLKDTEDLLILKKKKVRVKRTIGRIKKTYVLTPVLPGTCCVCLVNSLNLSVLPCSSVISIQEYCGDGNEISISKAKNLDNLICNNIITNNTNMRD